ncbi:hypothetical protein AV530_015168 [Patagioenas fasciata monilis]|uniref:Uncharacterized protein n=1 Tax=Patagioenas fasciata monilis TaxID=372326 RepID=A0A1V4K1F6_PATFA|nr:hypothetical protein AV530_015168 [Patagioenas fasciata monilis]
MEYWNKWHKMKMQKDDSSQISDSALHPNVALTTVADRRLFGMDFQSDLLKLFISSCEPRLPSDEGETLVKNTGAERLRSPQLRAGVHPSWLKLSHKLNLASRPCCARRNECKHRVSH